MKPLLKNSLITILSFLSFSGYCQLNNSENIIQYSRINTFDLRSKELVGSPYLNENLLPAKFSSDSKIYSLRYNAYFDEMEFEKNGKSYHLPKTLNYTIKFINSHKIYEVFSIKEKGKMIAGFFVVLYKGDNISLLNKEKIKLYNAVKPKTGYDKYQPPSLKRLKDKLYIGYKNNTAIELPKKKKQLLKLFSSKSKKIELFAKENNYGFKKQKDLVEIFKFYNSLD
mgnify:CR=1 FL=1